MIWLFYEIGVNSVSNDLTNVGMCMAKKHDIVVLRSLVIDNSNAVFTLLWMTIFKTPLYLVVLVCLHWLLITIGEGNHRCGKNICSGLGTGFTQQSEAKCCWLYICSQDNLRSTKPCYWRRWIQRTISSFIRIPLTVYMLPGSHVKITSPKVQILWLYV